SIVFIINKRSASSSTTKIFGRTCPVTGSMAIAFPIRPSPGSKARFWRRRSTCSEARLPPRKTAGTARTRSPRDSPRATVPRDISGTPADRVMRVVAARVPPASVTCLRRLNQHVAAPARLRARGSYHPLLFHTLDQLRGLVVADAEVALDVTDRAIAG